MPVLEKAYIRDICIYPIKSCGGIELNTAFLTPSGLQISPSNNSLKDHEMGFFEENKENGYHLFVTQRNKGMSVLAKIKPELVGGALRLTWEGKDEIFLPLDVNNGHELPVKIWDSLAYAIDQGEKIAEWASDHTLKRLRLAKAVGPFYRRARQNFVPNSNLIRFPDGYPVHWFDISDVNELSKKAGVEVPWQRFRPQIVTEGLAPQACHRFYGGRIKGVEFIDAKPCDRCPIPAIDQETGEFSRIKPLEYLKKYKKWERLDGETGKNYYIFGENMLPRGACYIDKGETLTFTSSRYPQLVYG